MMTTMMILYPNAERFIERPDERPDARLDERLDEVQNEAIDLVEALAQVSDVIVTLELTRRSFQVRDALRDGLSLLMRGSKPTLVAPVVRQAWASGISRELLEEDHMMALAINVKFADQTRGN
jgi:hypothetical protein